MSSIKYDVLPTSYKLSRYIRRHNDFQVWIENDGFGQIDIFPVRLSKWL